MHESPSKPDDVVFTVTLSLSVKDVSGYNVAWEVSEITFNQPAGNGHGARSWSEELPAVDTLDGYWWIEHGDVENPDLAEFTLPPLIAGTAEADSMSYEDLEYDPEGVSPAGARRTP
jgi:hypothetical protein